MIEINKKDKENNYYFKLLKEGKPIREIQELLTHGVHRPEHVNTHNIDIMGGNGFAKLVFGDLFTMYYTPTKDKNPYLLDDDVLFIKNFGRKGYYITINKEKETINDAWDDFKSFSWGSKSIFYIPQLKSLNDLDDLDKLYINYIVYLKQNYFPDGNWGDEVNYIEEVGEFFINLRNKKQKEWELLIERYPILLKSEYNWDAFTKSLSFNRQLSEWIIGDAYVNIKKPKDMYDKNLIYGLPTE